MKRTDFIRGYAARSGLSDKWAELGFIDVGGHKRIAMPCGCEEDNCSGWAMISAEAVLDHLFFYTPDNLRTAYRETISALDV